MIQEHAPLLEIERVSVRFRSVGPLSALLRGIRDPYLDAVLDVSMSLAKGQTYGLVGESGAGKTTLGRCIIGLARADSGSIRFRGEELTGLSASEFKRHRRHIGMMFQDPVASLSPRLTVRALITEPFYIHRVKITDMDERAAALLSMVGLAPHFFARYPHELSGGQARRVGVARALALEPSLIIADEPTAGLDVSVQGEVLNLMAELQERLELGYLIITHNLPVVRHVSDRLAIMYLGRFVEQGDADRIFARPRPPVHESAARRRARARSRQAPGDRLARGRGPEPREPPAGVRVPHPVPIREGALPGGGAGAYRGRTGSFRSLSLSARGLIRSFAHIPDMESAARRGVGSMSRVFMGSNTAPIREIENVWIPLPDGERLAARVWLPADAEIHPVPAIVEYLPYRKRDLMSLSDEQYHPWFAAHGYACLRIDLRGSGDSSGLLVDEYLVQEQEDALVALRWIAVQSWCCGRIGMMGISWSGFNALQVAARRPPELGAIITVASTDDRYRDDVHYMGGWPVLTDHMSWGAAFMLDLSLPPDPAIVGDGWRRAWRERCAALEPPFIEWLRHPDRDAFWRHGSVNEDYRAIECPVFVVSGWADGYINAAFRLMQHLEVPRRGLVGPWVHAYPNLSTLGPRVGFLQEALRWWDRWLKDADNGVEDELGFAIWMQESQRASRVPDERRGRWVAIEGWPPAPAAHPSVDPQCGWAFPARQTKSAAANRIAPGHRARRSRLVAIRIRG